MFEERTIKFLLDQKRRSLQSISGILAQRFTDRNIDSYVNTLHDLSKRMKEIEILEEILEVPINKQTSLVIDGISIEIRPSIEEKKVAT